MRKPALTLLEVLLAATLLAVVGVVVFRFFFVFSTVGARVAASPAGDRERFAHDRMRASLLHMIAVPQITPVLSAERLSFAYVTQQDVSRVADYHVEQGRLIVSDRTIEEKKAGEVTTQSDVFDGEVRFSYACAVGEDRRWVEDPKAQKARDCRAVRVLFGANATAVDFDAPVLARSAL